MKPLMTLLLRAFVCTAVVAAATADEPASRAGWIDLFNGQNLEGWVKRGGAAKFRVEDGQIIGTAVPDKQNTFLCTARDFTDFILELEFKVDPALNSGVQIRSRAHDRDTVLEWNGKTIKIPAGRVHGLQVEIDPSQRAWTGGVHGEGGVGWLYNLEKNEPARKAFKPGEWNKFHIEARGDSIKTWLNDVPAADLKNALIPSGFIGLQVHAIGNRIDHPEVRFRHIRLKSLPNGNQGSGRPGRHSYRR